MIDPNEMPSEGFVRYVEHKIRWSVFPDNIKEYLEMEIAVCNLERAIQILEELENNQVDPIYNGAYNQKDIHKKLDQHT